MIARLGCDADAAFEWLRRRARSTRTRLHDVCAAVVANAHEVAENQPGTD